LIQNQIEDAQESYPNREIIFESEDIVKEVDETLFGIAIINLIENALKYSQDRVYVKLSHDKISVRDTGIGIAQQDIERITKKFYRVSTNGWNNSLGVGLSLVSNIVAQHNFRLNIQSIQNEGSTFEILFSSLVPTE
jgi:signal transduction histidine kinase